MKSPSQSSTSLDRVWVTIWASRTGTTILSAGRQSLGHVAETRIGRTLNRAKSDLPLISLTRFGTKRTGKGALRHRDNVLECGGCEGDYAVGFLSFAEAVVCLKRARIPCIVYTTSSHTPAAPRWRVLVPFSRLLAPATRVGMVSRLNGVFPVDLEGESWTRSQAYHFGSPCELAIIDGADWIPIDQRDDLGEGRGKPGVDRGKPQGKPDDFAGKPAEIRPPNPEGYDSGPDPVDDLIAAIAAGGHNTNRCLNSLCAQMAASGAPADQIIAKAEQALLRRPERDRHESWQRHLEGLPSRVAWFFQLQREHPLSQGEARHG
jgi:hypothetical protein